jgi:GNAT superfamily N-acetyltransferase
MEFRTIREDEFVVQLAIANAFGDVEATEHDVARDRLCIIRPHVRRVRRGRIVRCAAVLFSSSPRWTSAPLAPRWVGVLPTHRRRGILTELMARILDQAADRREPIAMLLASKASPRGASIPMHCRVRRDRIDRGGGVTLRHDSRLHHIKVGRRHAGTRVLMLVAGLDVRIVSEDGELLRELVLDPSRSYQPMNRSA